MYCYQCGKQIKETDRFCQYCAAPQNCQDSSDSQMVRAATEQNEQNDVVLLIQRAMKGDDSVWGQVYDKTHRYVYYMILKFLRSEQDAEDITQDVYIQVICSIGQLYVAESFFAWLRSIVCSKCRDFAKKKKPLLLDEEGTAVFEETPEISDDFLPDAVLNNSEHRRMILEIVDALPYLQRQTVMFYYYDEIAVEQIARLMECPAGTVKSRLNYARQQIKKGVEEHERKGVKLYGTAALPVLAILLQEQAKTLTIPQTLSGGLAALLRQAGSTAAEAAKTAAQSAASPPAPTAVPAPPAGTAPPPVPDMGTTPGGGSLAGAAQQGSGPLGTLSRLPVWVKSLSLIAVLAILLSIPLVIILFDRDDHFSEPAGGSGTEKLEWEIVQMYYVDESNGLEDDILQITELPFVKGTSAAAAKINAYYYDNFSLQGYKEYNRTTEKSLDKKYDNLPTGKEYSYYQTSCCAVTYEGNGVISFTFKHTHYLGGQFEVSCQGETFYTKTGEKLKITDVMYGSETEILGFFQSEFRKEHKGYGDEEPLKPSVDVLLSDDGLVFYGYRKNYGGRGGISTTIPFSRTDWIKPPFAQ